MSEEKLKIAVIREELVKLTGDAVSALVLNQAVLSYESTKSMDETFKKMVDNFIEQGDFETAKKVKANYREGWFYKSANSFYKEIMISSRSTVHRRLEELVSKGWMKKGGQYFKPAKTKKGDIIEDNWWTVNIEQVRKDLAKLGYTLKGYPMWNDPEEAQEQNEDINPVHHEQGGVHHEQEDVHHEQEGVHHEQGGVHHEHQHRYYIDSSIDTPKDTSIELPSNINSLLEEEERHLPKEEYKYQFSKVELKKAYDFIAPQMRETLIDLNFEDEYRDRVIFFMHQKGIKYFSATEYRRKRIEIELNDFKDKKGKRIQDPALYIVNGIKLTREGKNDDTLAYHLEKAKKLSKAQKKKEEDIKKSTKSVPFYNWLEQAN